MTSGALKMLALGGVSVLVACACGASPTQKPGEGWSESVNGLQARVTLVERPKVNGTRQIVPYLELRNVGDSAAPLKVRCSGSNVSFELVERAGKPAFDGKSARAGYVLPRSGPHADPGTIVLPFDSSIRIGMHCSNWGVPKDAAAMVSTDSGAWVLEPTDKAKVSLQCTLKGMKIDAAPYDTWHGEINAPPVLVDWKE